MHLSVLDWLIVVAFFAVTLLISLYYRKVAEKGMLGFFLGGRNLTWFLAGISMVATTFAADTPLAVTEIVADKGIAGNWLWWSFVLGGMLTTIFFARLWHRSGVLTELELIDIRYSGLGAKWLRNIKAIYLGLFMNALVIAWVNKALISILAVFFDIPENELIWYAAGSMLFVAIYSSISGLKGVVVTDMFQFLFAMTGCVVLSILVVNSDKIGGITGLKEKLPPETLNFFPSLGKVGSGSFSLGWGDFIAFIGVIWWSSWYPGAEPGGGGYVAQRMMSTKNEKHSLLATLFFQAAHYCLRPWPWILVGLCAIVLYPDLAAVDKKLGYVMAMRDFLPNGLKGLLLAAFFGAYMSTISTQLNWGASFLVNDLFLPLSKSYKSDKQVVRVSRITTMLMMFFALWVTTMVGSIKEVWAFILECGAGLGLVLILRWYWWRINVWSEITATIVPFAVFGTLKILQENGFDSFWIKSPGSIFTTVGITTIAWLLVTFLTKPTDESKLQTFFDKVKPMGSWGKYGADNRSLPYLFLAWLGGVSCIVGILFFTGSLILQLSPQVYYYLMMAGGGFGLFYIASLKAGLFSNN
jgi:Na+/proline symporter